ncbi:MAG: MraY family glycosyltransferase [Thiohalocapsa sp.]|jgi:UDP-GlcNAc:undecaprenyl-phosphate GlcNAc-1-phosphate transferase
MDINALIGLVLALAGTTVLALLLRRPARRIGLVDHPTVRKTHCTPTPLTGGIALFLAFTAGLLVAAPETPGLVPILAGGALLVAFGVIDDVREIHFRLRFVVQAAAAGCLVFGADVRVESLGNLLGFGPIELGLLSVPFSIFAVVGLINAINMLDGLDGLAGGVTLVSLAGVLLVAGAAVPALVMPALILAAGVIGFLLVNYRFPWRRRAPVFMGDGGSTLLGYCLAWFIIALPQQAPESVSPIAALWLVGLPVADTLATIWRRKRQGLSAFHAGHNHIHHLLQRAGFGTNTTVLLILCVAFAFALIGLNQIFSDSLPEPFWSYLFVVTLAGIYKLLEHIAPLMLPLRERLTGRAEHPAPPVETSAEE